VDYASWGDSSLKCYLAMPQAVTSRPTLFLFLRNWGCVDIVRVEILGQEMSSTVENRSFELGMFLVLGAVLGCYKGAGGGMECRGCPGAVGWMLQDSAMHHGQ